MQNITIKTPFIVQLSFLLLLLAPPVIFFALYEVWNAKTISPRGDCRKEWEDGFFERIDPSVQKDCWKRFEYFTRFEIQRMENYQKHLTI